MHNIATSHRLAGHYQRAIELHTQVLESRRKVLGPGHPDTLACICGLAEAYRRAGQVEKALFLQKEGLEAIRTIFGPKHPTTIDKMNCVACAYLSAGKFDKAIPLFQQTVDTAREVLGASHPDTVNALKCFISCYSAAGQHDKAIKLCEQTLELIRKERAAEPEVELGMIIDLSSCYFHAGLFREASSVGEQVVAHCIKIFGPTDWRTILWKGNLADEYRTAGELEKSRSLSEELLDFRRHENPTNPTEIVWMLTELAETLLMQQKWSEAEPLMHEALKILALKPDDDLQKLIATSHLGASLAGQNRFAEAEPLVLESYKALERQPAAHPYRIKPVREHVIALYEAWNKPEQASRWRKEFSDDKTK
jgi:tetratricopeptide (TPR) repeat protein